DRVRPRVGDVERAAGQRESLWVFERGFRERTFAIAAQAAADHVLHGAVRTEQQHAMVARVGDDDPAVRGDRQLPRIGERLFLLPWAALETHGRGCQRSFRAGLGELIDYERFQHRRVRLTWRDRGKRAVG